MCKRSFCSMGTPYLVCGLFLLVAWSTGNVPAGEPTYPAARANGAAGNADAVLRAYPCPASEAASLSQSLVARFGRIAGVRIVADERTSQVLVMAGPDVHSQISAIMQAPAGIAPGALAAPPRPLPAAQPRLDAVNRQELQLRHTTAARLESVLAMALGERLSRTAVLSPTATSYQISSSTGTPLGLSIDRAGNRVWIEGSGTAFDSCVDLIRALDAPKPPEDESRCLISLASMDIDDVKDTVAAIQTTNGPAARRVGQPNLVAQVVQREPSTDSPPPADQIPPTEATPTETVEDVAGLIGPVQIEMLEGLDVFVIRGRSRDVQRVVELIQQIEQLSVETEPAIVVHSLGHVDCEALATLVTQLYEEVFSLRQGTVSITALVKPNALLLIGRQESVDTVIDLVKRLDRPVPPESQFRVFRLRYSPAGTAQETLDEFFEEREGLGTKIRVTADFRSNSLVVQASPRDMAEIAAMIAELDTRDLAAINELRVFKLKNSMAEDLLPTLQDAISGQATMQQQQGEEKSIGLQFVTIDASGRRLLNSGILTDVRVTADARANALLISAPPESMPLIEALVDQLDQLPVAEAQLKVFTILNGDASGLVEMLEALFGQTAEPPVRTGAVEGDSSLVPLRFAVDVRTNSIIASGSVGDLTVVEAILLKLDESDVRDRRGIVYRLKNAPAPEVAEAINEYIDSERSVTQFEPGLISAFEQLERDVVVVSEPVSNSLIISATPEYYDRILEIVEELDKQPPMVMIQVLIAEVQLNDTEEFGIEVGLQDSILFDRSLLEVLDTTTNTSQQSTPSGIVTVTEEVIRSANNNPGFLFNNTSPLGNSGAANSLAGASMVGSQGLSNFGVGRLNSELGFGGLVLSAGSESVSMLLRALQEDRRIDVLSRPQIMTMDNQPAFIQIGERVPIITGTLTNEAGQTYTVEMENVGLIIGVTPRISPEGLVVMEIDAEKSEVGPESEGIPISVSQGEVIRQPRIRTITAQTTISATDGQTVLLGGLISTNKSSVDRRVPFISEIPILGHLFRYQGYSCNRTELLIILTPRIVENEEDAELIKQQEAARMHWCLCDVLEMQDDIAFRSREGDWADVETMTVYPDGEPVDDLDLEDLNLPVQPVMPRAY